MAWTRTSGGVWIVRPWAGAAQAVFLSTFSSATNSFIYNVCGKPQSALPAPNVWITINLSPLLVGIDEQPIAVDLGGWKIITNGTNTQLSDLTVAFQTPGAGSNPNAYIDQGIGIGRGGGDRDSYHGLPVVLDANGRIDFAWGRGDAYQGEYPANPIPNYPTGAAYQLTICVEKVYT